MRIPHPENVPVEEIVQGLRACADSVVSVDGDRDHMNPSNMKCGQTQAIARVLLIAADKLEGLTPADPFQGQAS